jgi:small GTP-binding protein
LIASAKSVRKRIVFIGRKNVGKSSLISAFLRTVSYKDDENEVMRAASGEITTELPPYGRVVIVDTSPIDEISEQKQERINNTLNAISPNDFAVVVLDARQGLSADEKKIFYYLKNTSIHFLAAVNKIEYGINSELINGLRALNIVHFEISCKENVGIDALKSRITRLLPMEQI